MKPFNKANRWRAQTPRWQRDSCCCTANADAFPYAHQACGGGRAYVATVILGFIRSAPAGPRYAQTYPRASAGGGGPSSILVIVKAERRSFACHFCCCHRPGICHILLRPKRPDTPKAPEEKVIWTTICALLKNLQGGQGRLMTQSIIGPGVDFCAFSAEGAGVSMTPLST